MPKEGVAIKDVVKMIRRAVLRPADPEWQSNPFDTFFAPEYVSIRGAHAQSLKDHDSVPHHCLMHLIHALQVLSWKHPHQGVRALSKSMYHDWCDAFHMGPESYIDFCRRLGKDDSTSHLDLTDWLYVTWGNPNGKA